MDLAAQIAKAMYMTQKDAKRIIQMIFDEMIEVLVTEGRFEIRDFGVYEVKTRKPRMARNPRTGESVPVSASKTVTFKAGRYMKIRVNEDVLDDR